MFDKKHRFSFKKGAPRKIFSQPAFIVRYEENQEGLLCAVVVGKKIDKRAVFRNKIKRKILNILKEIIDVNISFTVVIYIKKQILGLSDNEIKEELLKGFQKIKIL